MNKGALSSGLPDYVLHLPPAFLTTCIHDTLHNRLLAQGSIEYPAHLDFRFGILYIGQSGTRHTLILDSEIRPISISATLPILILDFKFRSSSVFVFVSMLIHASMIVWVPACAWVFMRVRVCSCVGLCVSTWVMAVIAVIVCRVLCGRV